MTLQPMNERIIVKPASREEATQSGILLPGANPNDKPEQGEVIGVCKESALKVGDKVVFKKYAPDEVKIGDDRLLILAELDVMAIIRE